VAGFLYFSLVTATTVGYGDIVPQTPGAPLSGTGELETMGMGRRNVGIAASTPPVTAAFKPNSPARIMLALGPRVNPFHLRRKTM